MVQEGRLISESTGDQFEFSNIEPKGMTRLELYQGYRRLLEQLYAFRHYRERTLAFILGRGPQIHGGHNIRAGDLGLFARVMRVMLFEDGVRRAFFTLRLLGATLLRRPSRIKDAVSFALCHKAFSDYARELCGRLDRDIELLAREAAYAEPQALPPSKLELG